MTAQSYLSEAEDSAVDAEGEIAFLITFVTAVIGFFFLVASVMCKRKKEIG